MIHKLVDSRTQAGRSVFYLQLTDLKDNYINVFLHGERGEYASFPIGGLVYLINPDGTMWRCPFHPLDTSSSLVTPWTTAFVAVFSEMVRSVPTL